ncbi:STAS domain-containing protein [Kitasatospora sp. NPDC056184]|uniref:STAS domain-containing protein n=1 Tax=Kitasatospora sp. NPDC056184 TaxID=3345738 RepID=UPI0035D7CFDE
METEPKNEPKTEPKNEPRADRRTGPQAGPEAPADRVLRCDLGALTAPDLAVVDALARLRLAAARHGVRLVLRNAGGPLRELLAFSGLAAVLPVEEDAAGLLPGPFPGRQSRRQAEEREQHLGVEEVGEPGDPAR